MDLRIASTWDGSPARDDEAVSLRLVPTQAGLVIEVFAPYHDDPSPPGLPGPTPGLWDHEVVELFVLGPNERYLEVELAPGGHHLVLQLVGIRQAIATSLPLEFEARVLGERWTGRAVVPWALLPAGPHRINAYAIHGQGAERRYLAWAPVPGPQPDFHRLDCFVEAYIGLQVIDTKWPEPSP